MIAWALMSQRAAFSLRKRCVAFLSDLVRLCMTQHFTIIVYPPGTQAKLCYGSMQNFRKHSFLNWENDSIIHCFFHGHYIRAVIVGSEATEAQDHHPCNWPCDSQIPFPFTGLLAGLIWISCWVFGTRNSQWLGCPIEFLSLVHVKIIDHVSHIHLFFRS